MSLKLEYELKVVQLKQKHLETLVDQVIKSCKDNINAGNELPYVVTLKSVNINSVHDLTPLLEEAGIKCRAWFEPCSSITVTVEDFI